MLQYGQVKKGQYLEGTWEGQRTFKVLDVNKDTITIQIVSLFDEPRAIIPWDEYILEFMIICKNPYLVTDEYMIGVDQRHIRGYHELYNETLQRVKEAMKA